MIRKAIVTDIPHIQNWIYERAKDIQKKELSQWEFYLTQENTQIVLDDFEQNTLYVLVDKNETPIGSFTLTLGDDWDFNLWPDHKDKPSFYLHRVVVPLKLKGEKIGSKLISSAQKIASTAGYSLRLDCARFNPFLKPFYLQHGFVLKSTLEEFLLFEWKEGTEIK
ncbi:GNAT family N-acetyltransferase [Alkalihalobacillus sp. 1P02AB]|uniref:GNAT family N-acetyltransferase n=1 Tax=Alkalihalobacillus sp. 1P02AB TaxID=3132260 RepID=UPI0039A4226E